jgi:hypothetical protein
VASLEVTMVRLAPVFALLLAACTDPEPVALEACRAMPQLATDAAGLELMRPVLDPREVALIEKAEPTLGLQKVGSEGLAKLRAASTCAIDEVDSAGTGRWAVKVKRTIPTVAADGTIGDPQEQVLEWQVVDGDDHPYVETGARYASSKRASIAEAIEQRDFKRVAAGWRGLVNEFPDPVLTVDVADAEDQDEGWEYRNKLAVRAFGATDPHTLVAVVSNTGDRPVRRGVFALTTEVEGEKVSAMATTEAIPPGQTAELRATLEATMTAEPASVLVDVKDLWMQR